MPWTLLFIIAACPKAAVYIWLGIKEALSCWGRPFLQWLKEGPPWCSRGGTSRDRAGGWTRLHLSSFSVGSQPEAAQRRRGLQQRHPLSHQQQRQQRLRLRLQLSSGTRPFASRQSPDGPTVLRCQRWCQQWSPHCESLFPLGGPLRCGRASRFRMPQQFAPLIPAIF